MAAPLAAMEVGTAAVEMAVEPAAEPAAAVEPAAETAAAVLVVPVVTVAALAALAAVAALAAAPAAPAAPPEAPAARAAAAAQGRHSRTRRNRSHSCLTRGWRRCILASPSTSSQYQSRWRGMKSAPWPPRPRRAASGRRHGDASRKQRTDGAPVPGGGGRCAQCCRDSQSALRLCQNRSAHDLPAHDLPVRRPTWLHCFSSCSSRRKPPSKRRHPGRRWR